MSGSIIFTLPNLDALKIAFICTLKKSGFSKLNLIPLRPRAGLVSLVNLLDKLEGNLSAPRSRVLITTGRGLRDSTTRLYASNCSSSLRILFFSKKRNSVLNNPIPDIPISIAFCFFRVLDIRH